jgi:hypothetical protein
LPHQLAAVVVVEAAQVLPERRAAHPAEVAEAVEVEAVRPQVELPVEQVAEPLAEVLPAERPVVAVAVAAEQRQAERQPVQQEPRVGRPVAALQAVVERLVRQAEPPVEVGDAVERRPLQLPVDLATESI